MKKYLKLIENLLLENLNNQQVSAINSIKKNDRLVIKTSTSTIELIVIDAIGYQTKQFTCVSTKKNNSTNKPEFYIHFSTNDLSDFDNGKFDFRYTDNPNLFSSSPSKWINKKLKNVDDVILNGNSLKQLSANSNTISGNTSGNTSNSISGNTSGNTSVTGGQVATNILSTMNLSDDPDLRRAFFKTPGFWSLLKGELTNKKAPGKGVMVVNDILNKYLYNTNKERLGEYVDYFVKNNKLNLQFDNEFRFVDGTNNSNYVITENVDFNGEVLNNYDIKLLTTINQGKIPITNKHEYIIVLKSVDSVSSENDKEYDYFNANINILDKNNNTINLNKNFNLTTKKLIIKIKSEKNTGYYNPNKN